MRFKQTQRFSRWPSVGRFLLPAASLFLCFITGVGSVTAQTTDDHGNYLNDATNLPLGSSIAGRIDPGDDLDVFRLDLSGALGQTHFWIYTTGTLDTLGRLYDSNIELLTSNDNTTSGGGVVVETNFRLSWTLSPGIYYVAVYSADSTTTGDYLLHARSDDHGDYFSVATSLSLGASVSGRIIPGFDRDVFKLDLSGASGNTHVSVYTTGDLDTQGWLYDSNDTSTWITRNDDTTRSDRVETNFRITWTLEPRVYYLSVRSFDRTVTGGGDYTLYFQTRIDDHGTSFPTATALPLGSSIAGRINSEDDQDVFELDLSGTSGTTDVWIYTAGELDTRGWLYDSSGGDYLVFNNDSYIVGREGSFHIRRSLSSGVYYILVRSWQTADGDYATGDYTLHAEVVTGPGNTTGTAATLSLDSPAPGMIDTASDADYFRLDLAESRNLVISAQGLALIDGNSGNFLPFEPLDGPVFDNSGAEISVNVLPQEFRYRFEVYRWGFRVEDAFDAGVYYIKVTTPADVSFPVPYTILAYEDTDYGNFIDDCEAATVALNKPETSDPLYGCQWHLRNQEQGGEDINVETVWAEGINGEGINIAVVDDGMYYAHEDLAANVSTTLNHNYDTGSHDIYSRYDHHGTAVAGIIAARDNGFGVRGVAPMATVYGYNYLADYCQQCDDINTADAMSRNRVVTAVSNNSWGPRGGPWLGRANQLWESAVDSGIREGHDGKGVFYVFAGGNGGRGHRENPDGTPVGGHYSNAINRGDDSNLDELANYYAVTAVCAVNDGDTRSVYSEKGANLWVCAPSWDFERRGIATTENVDRYRDDFGGTSAAAPIVSGMAALLRQANPELTWRDLKLILAASARKNDAGNPGWAEGARKYGAGPAADRYHFNHEYGFGVVDAKAAVDLAKGWTNVPPLESVSAESRAAVTIPPPFGSVPQTVTATLTLNTGIRFTEFVEINADFNHTSFRDMNIELVSPSGAVSKLTVPFNTRYYTDTYRRPDGSIYDVPYFVHLDGEFRFGSARHLGEDPNGVWTLRLTDHFPALGGTLRSWSIRVYGHVSRPGAPTITTPITAGSGSLTVAWSAPSDDGGAVVTAYDLRYIQTSADETADSNWTVLEDVWTTGPDPLEYTITGLTDSTQYDVQLRAVNSAGTGPWSATATGATTVLAVVFSDLNWTSAQLQNHIARHIVENGYGYPTIAVSDTTLQSLQALRDGDSHVMMEIWLPRLSLVWEEARESGEVFSPGTSLGNDWRSAFVIPAYLQAQHPGLDSVEDLKDQRYKDLFKTAETGGKARLVSCVIGWDCAGVNAEQVEAYGLADHVHMVNPISGQALDASLNDAYEKQEPWLGFQWGTSDPALLLDLVRLEEPEYSDECWRTTKACAYEDSTILIGVNSSLPDLAPDVVEFLRHWDFSIDVHLRSVVRWLDSNPEASREDAALHWLGSNVDVWSGWVTGEAAAGVLATLPATSIAPSVNVTGSADALVRLNSLIHVMATFSEPVSGFVVEDIVVGNGTVSNFAGSGAVYTFDVTPNAIGEVTVDIAAGVAEDADGKGNTAAPQFSLGIPYDDDGNGGISKDEAIAAVRDYFAGKLTKAQTIAVIRIYFASSS